jgi:DNA-binding LacI/PurR family transcriptional regulator
MHHAIHRSGVMAVELLIELIEQPGGASQPIVLPTERVVRASYGSLMKHAFSEE